MRAIQHITACMLMLMVVFAGCSSSPQYSRYSHFMSVQNYEGARKMLQERVTVQSDDYESWFLLGKVYLALSDFENARSAFDQSLSHSSRFNRDIVFHLEKSLRQELAAGVRLMESKRFEEALRHFENGMTIDPGRQKLYPLAGFCYFQLEEFDQAMELYAKAVDLDASDSESWFNLAGLAFQKEQYSEAAGWAERCLETDPGFLPAHRMLVYAGLELGDYELSEKSYQIIKKREPDLELTANYAFGLFNSEEYDRAIPHLLHLKSITEAGYSDKHRERDRISGGSAEAGTVPADRSTNLSYENVIRTLAEANYNTRNYGKMAEYYRILWEKNPDDLQLLLNIILAYELKGDTAVALSWQKILRDKEKRSLKQE